MASFAPFLIPRYSESNLFVTTKRKQRNVSKTFLKKTKKKKFYLYSLRNLPKYPMPKLKGAYKENKSPKEKEKKWLA